MGYDWEKIFKEKNNKELLDIYTGDSLLDYEASMYAGLELKIRNYDFNKILKVHNQKIEELEISIENCKNIKFTKSKYFRQQISNTIGLIIVFIILINNAHEFQTLENFNLYKFIFYAVIFIFGILSAKWSYNRYEKEKKEKIEIKTKLLQLYKINSNTI